MRDDYHFSKAKRARDVPHLQRLRATNAGKTRITIMLDDDVIEAFRERAGAEGRGYQTEINEALRKYLASPDHAPVTVKKLRQVIREELERQKSTG